MTLDLVGVGLNATDTLLVVPHRTTSSLAVVLLRVAAAMTVPTHEGHTEMHETAGRILRSAQQQAALATIPQS